jgi:hypothetical protein
VLEAGLSLKFKKQVLNVTRETKNSKKMSKYLGIRWNKNYNFLLMVLAYRDHKMLRYQDPWWVSFKTHLFNREGER